MAVGSQLSRARPKAVLRLTVKKPMHVMSLAILDELKRRRHESVQVLGQWLSQVVMGTEIITRCRGV